jgi:hypothetical protein
MNTSGYASAAEDQGADEATENFGGLTALANALNGQPLEYQRRFIDLADKTLERKHEIWRSELRNVRILVFLLFVLDILGFILAAYMESRGDPEYAAAIAGGSALAALFPVRLLARREKRRRSDQMPQFVL